MPTKLTVIAVALMPYLLGTGVWGLTAENDYDPKKFEVFKNRILAEDAKNRWKGINWEKGFQEALRKSKATQKPLFVFLVVGHLGQMDAAEC